MRNPCTFDNPRTGDKCVMAMGHFGKHRSGDIDNPKETWVIPCTDGPCDFHLNWDQGDVEWEECINCGQERPITYQDEPATTPAHPSVSPPVKRFIFFKGWGIYCLTVNLFKTKSIEIQVGKFSPAPYMINLELHWSIRCDHAGPEFEVGVWGYHFRTKMYDTRHWDYGNKKWEE